MKIKVKCFAVMLFLSLVIYHSLFALCVLCAVIIHELGHIFAAKHLNINISECKIDIFGASLSPEFNNFSYKNEIVLCACGPLFNIFTSLAIMPFWLLTKQEYLLYFILSSLTLALLNLLPIKGFDGGRICQSILCLISEPHLANRSITIISFVCILVLWLISVYLLLIARSNLSLFVFSISLFIKIFLNES